MTTGRRRTKGDGQTASGADDWNPLGTEAKVYFPSCLRAESVGAELSCFRFFTSRHLEVWKKVMGKGIQRERKGLTTAVQIQDMKMERGLEQT